MRCVLDTSRTLDVDDICDLYKNDLGDADLVEQEDDTTALQNMADFLYDIYD
jgi:hypothetical protein